MMKKFYLIALMAAATLSANAQQKLNLSTYSGTDLARYDGKTCDVTVNRQTFKGWNTLSLPFDLSEQELNEAFGSDCRLEKLVSVDETAGAVQLNFQDCKAEGVQANIPYILYFTGETASRKITKQAVLTDAPSKLSFTTSSGDVVTMEGVKKHISGVGFYGVMAIDNGDAKFVKVHENTNGFFATRCYIQLSSGNSKQLTTRHLAAGNPTGINAVAADNELVDVYNLAGGKVASQVRAAEVNSLKAGVYVVKGQKILVK